VGNPWLGDIGSRMLKKLSPQFLSSSAYEVLTKIALKNQAQIILQESNRNCTQGLGAFCLRLAPANIQEERGERP
jgi:hypothetical protein